MNTASYFFSLGFVICSWWEEAMLYQILQASVDVWLENEVLFQFVWFLSWKALLQVYLFKRQTLSGERNIFSHVSKQGNKGLERKNFQPIKPKETVTVALERLLPKGRVRLMLNLFCFTSLKDIMVLQCVFILVCQSALQRAAFEWGLLFYSPSYYYYHFPFYEQRGCSIKK